MTDDPDKPWRLPNAKRMTFDDMAARAQYEWQRAEDAEAEVKHQADRIEELEAKLGMIQDEWTNAVYGDLENGVESPLAKAAAKVFYMRYPLVSNFGATINRIIDGGKGDE